MQRLRLMIFRLLSPKWRQLVVRFLTPNYTLGVITFVVTLDRRILLVRQSYRDGWAMPGGLMKRGEQPEQAAHRELLEETGITASVSGVHRTKVATKTQFVTFYNIAVVEESSALSQSSEEILEAAWFDFENLPKMANDVGELTPQDLVAIDNALLSGS